MVLEGLKDVVEQLKWVSEAAAGNEAVLGKLLLKSEVAGAGMTIVIELLLDVHHVSAGILQLPKLCASTEVPKVAELWQPRPGRGICERHREKKCISIAQNVVFNTFLKTKLMRWLRKGKKCTSYNEPASLHNVLMETACGSRHVDEGRGITKPQRVPQTAPPLTTSPVGSVSVCVKGRR